MNYVFTQMKHRSTKIVTWTYLILFPKGGGGGIMTTANLSINQKYSTCLSGLKCWDLNIYWLMGFNSNRNIFTPFSFPASIKFLDKF